MQCPYCDAADSRVVDTTADPARREIRRRRECKVCGRRFSTVERWRVRMPLVVKYHVGSEQPRSEPFDAEKLRDGIQVACAKRPISQAAIDRLVASVEAQLQERGGGEVTSHEIGEMVIAELRELDEIAYIRYAIVFLGLEDLAAVRDEIDRLLTEQNHHSHPAAQ